jgi:hypothetical protein
MKTILDWYECLPENLKQKAIFNTPLVNCNREVPSFSHSLHSFNSFLWDDTLEGHSFWYEIYRFVDKCESQDIELTPDLDWPHKEEFPSLPKEISNRASARFIKEARRGGFGMNGFKILDKIKNANIDDIIFAENLQESLPMWASVLQLLLEKTGEENYLYFTFKDGSSLEYLSKKGNSKIDRLEKERDELKKRNDSFIEVLKGTEYPELLTQSLIRIQATINHLNNGELDLALSKCEEFMNDLREDEVSE